MGCVTFAVVKGERLCRPAIGAQLSFTAAAGGGRTHCLQVLLASCFGNWSLQLFRAPERKENCHSRTRLGTSVVYKILNS